MTLHGDGPVTSQGFNFFYFNFFLLFFFFFFFFFFSCQTIPILCKRIVGHYLLFSYLILFFFLYFNFHSNNILMNFLFSSLPCLTFRPPACDGPQPWWFSLTYYWQTSHAGIALHERRTYIIILPPLLHMAYIDTVTFFLQTCSIYLPLYTPDPLRTKPPVYPR